MITLELTGISYLLQYRRHKALIFRDHSILKHEWVPPENETWSHLCSVCLRNQRSTIRHISHFAYIYLTYTKPLSIIQLMMEHKSYTKSEFIPFILSLSEYLLSLFPKEILAFKEVFVLKCYVCTQLSIPLKQGHFSPTAWVWFVYVFWGRQREVEWCIVRHIWGF